MTADEIVNTIERFQSAWPWDNWSSEQVDEWCTALERIDAGIGEHVTVKLIRTRERTPTISAFLAEAHSEYERRRTTKPTLPPPAQKAIPAKVREKLAAAFAGRPIHDHHNGWAGCPTCVNYPPRSESA